MAEAEIIINFGLSTVEIISDSRKKACYIGNEYSHVAGKWIHKARCVVKKEVAMDTTYWSKLLEQMEKGVSQLRQLWKKTIQYLAAGDIASLKDFCYQN